MLDSGAPDPRESPIPIGEGTPDLERSTNALVGGWLLVFPSPILSDVARQHNQFVQTAQIYLTLGRQADMMYCGLPTAAGKSRV